MLVKLAGLAIAASLTLFGAAAETGPAAATGCATSVTYNTSTYCVATIADLKAGAYSSGTRVVLQNVFVLSGQRRVRTVGSIVPCPTGQYCGATINWTTTTVTFPSNAAAPALYWWIDLYGVVSNTGGLSPVAHVDRSYGGDPAFW
jgi:hypothetical protein